jgi:hypothetical protein
MDPCRGAGDFRALPLSFGLSRRGRRSRAVLDILTGSGIPESLFVDAVKRFEANVEDAAERVFAEERGAEEGGA